MAEEPQSAGKISMDGVNDSIISLFECPVCYEYLTPPIHQCKNAHNICASCKKKLKQCPTCRETFLDSRSLFVEQIAQKLLYPCKNAEVGCKEKHALNEIKGHHKECPYRLYECIPGKSENCPWRGRRFEIFGHISEGHPMNAWMTSENSILYEADILQGTSDIQLISALNEIFWYYFNFDVQKQKLHIVLQFIGPKELASSFKYVVDITSFDDEEVGLCFRNRVEPDVISLSTIRESERCVKIDKDQLKKFLGPNNSFAFILKVKKTQSASYPENATHE